MVQNRPKKATVFGVQIWMETWMKNEKENEVYKKFEVILAKKVVEHFLATWTKEIKSRLLLF